MCVCVCVCVCVYYSENNPLSLYRERIVTSRDLCLGHCCTMLQDVYGQHVQVSIGDLESISTDPSRTHVLRFKNGWAHSHSSSDGEGAG